MTASRGFWRGVWRYSDPKITLASVAGMALGAGFAAHEGPLAWGWLALTVIGVFCIEAAKNASGEVVDWDSGTDAAVADEDRSPFSGGKRVLVDGLMTRGESIGVAAVAYLLGASAGLAIVFAREPAVLWLGVAGVGVAYAYHGPPFRLSYRGLGELAVGLAYGPGVTAGTYLVQRGRVDVDVLLASIPLGMLIAGFLWINEFPDATADAAAGKRTLVVRLGRERAAVAYARLVGLAWLGVALLPLAGVAPGVLAGLVGLPLSVRAARRLRAAPEHTASIVPAQAWTLLGFVLFGVVGGLGAALLG
jgi:1,4-dihydroxy-2-naphthoate octaprenyltransferase